MKEPLATGNPGIARLLMFAGLTVLVVVVSLFTPARELFSMDKIREIAEGLGYWGPLVLILCGMLTPLFFIPRWPIAFAAGLLYGIVWGSLLATFASTLGAWLNYHLATSLLAPSAERMLKRFRISPNALKGDRAFLALFVLRAFPLSNFVVTNLVAGTLRIPLPTYLLASFLGMIPSSIMYSSWGKMMKKPSSSIYAVAVLSLTFIVVGTILVQKRLAPWLKKEERST